jgi:hypothetical protein
VAGAEVGVFAGAVALGVTDSWTSGGTSFFEESVDVEELSQPDAMQNRTKAAAVIKRIKNLHSGSLNE